MDILFFLGAAALLTVLAFPPYERVLLRRSADVIRDELGHVERAVAEAAAKREAEPGDRLTFSQYGPYLGDHTRLRKRGRDLFGNPLGEQVVGVAPAVSRATYEKLREVVSDAFWHPYTVEGEPALLPEQ